MFWVEKKGFIISHYLRVAFPKINLQIDKLSADQQTGYAFDWNVHHLFQSNAAKKYCSTVCCEPLKV